MTQKTAAAPVLAHRDGHKTQGIAKSCILIVHKIPRLVQRLLIGAGAGGALGVAFAVPWVGTVLTGIFASRGSNYISDLAKRLQNILAGDGE